jgi:hypothetical protein
MSFVFLTLTTSVSLIVIAVSVFTINNLENQIHNLKRDKRILEDELVTKINDLQIEYFENKEKEKIVLSHIKLLKSKVFTKVVSLDFLKKKINNNKSLLFCVCLKGDKADMALMLNSNPDELKNKRVLHKARGLVKKSQTTLNKKGNARIVEKRDFVNHLSHQVSSI